MDGSASPRNPSVAIESRSFTSCSLLVAWRSKASRASSRSMPQPSSAIRIRRRAAGLDLHADIRRPGIERILQQFFNHGRRALDNFARGDFIGDIIGKNADAAHVITLSYATLRLRRPSPLLPVRRKPQATPSSCAISAATLRAAIGKTLIAEQTSPTHAPLAPPDNCHAAPSAPLPTPRIALQNPADRGYRAPRTLEYPPAAPAPLSPRHPDALPPPPAKTTPNTAHTPPRSHHPAASATADFADRPPTSNTPRHLRRLTASSTLLIKSSRRRKPPKTRA